MKSAIYSGQVYHRRFGARRHTLRYRVIYLLLDLDELDTLAHVSPVLGINRAGLLSYHDRDHGKGSGAYRDWCLEVLREAEITDAGAAFQVLTTPRVLGYGFNPISVVYCRRADGSVGAMIYEVNNTFGERIAYVMPVTQRRRIIHQCCDKAMFVSPFYGLEGDYEFRVGEPLEALRLTIDYRLDGERQLRAVFQGERRPLTRRELVRAACAFPAAGIGLIAGIHYEALKLWLKGVPLVRRRPSKTTLAIGSEL